MLLYKSIIYIPPGSAYNSYNSLQYKLMSILFCDHIYCCNTVYTCVHSLYTVTVAYNHVAYMQRYSESHSINRRMYLCTCRLHRKYAVCEPYNLYVFTLYTTKNDA